MLRSYLDLLVAFVTDTQFACDFLVVGGQNLQFLFELGSERCVAGIADGKVVDARGGFFQLDFNLAFRAERRIIIDADLFQLTSERLDAALGNSVLVNGRLQLTLDFFVVGLDFSQLSRLPLDGLLQFNVGVVGNIQGHLQLSDLDLQLLLDALNLALQLGLGLNDASIQLLDFNAGLLATLGETREIAVEISHRSFLLATRQILG